MRILSITAQKPNSTGSGVLLTELVKELAAKGHEQAVVAGVYKEDKTEVPENTKIYPVIFNPPFMQNRTGYGLERLLLCQTNKSENKIYGSYV